jgi:PhnB protein
MATLKSAARKPAAKKVAAKKPVASKQAAARPKARKVAPIPKGYHTATPYLIVRGAADALAFYTRAFGAKETLRMAGPDGMIMHAEFKIGDSMLMLSEEMPDWGSKSPMLLGGSATHVMLYVKDCDAFVAKAVAAGATVAMPVATQFWGDRYGKIADPFGHVWSVGTHVEDVPPKEMKKRMAAAMEMKGDC